MQLDSLRSGAAVAVATLLLISCGAPAVSPTAPPSPVPPGTLPAATSTGAGTGSAEGLCGVFPSELAEAALGEPVSAPSGGDVLPRPNGIYCHYRAAGDTARQVEAQLRDVDRAGFEAQAARLDLTEPIEGVGEAAYGRDTSIMGYPGMTIIAWADGQMVSVSIDRAADRELLLAAAAVIAEAALAR